MSSRKATESAVTTVRLIVRQLRQVTERGEELLAENLALQSRTRVEEYQKCIAQKAIWRLMAAILVAAQIKKPSIIFQIRL